jgi:magnesium chelatase family protein
LLDRFDIHCAVPPVEMSTLSQSVTGERSGDVSIRVCEARVRQCLRNSAENGHNRNNVVLTLSELECMSPLDRESRRLLDTAGHRLGLSARAFVRIYRVARTIADLAGTEQIEPEHVAEAIQGRLLDRQPLIGN